MSTREIQRYALEQMAQYGLTNAGWTFKWDRAKGRAGQCNYTRKTISLSLPLAQMRDEADTRMTILHEIAHARTPGAKHGPEWRVLFMAMGGNGKRCFADTAATEALAKYRLECVVTGRVLGTVNRKGKRLANATCKCHHVKPLWITQN